MFRHVICNNQPWQVVLIIQLSNCNDNKHSNIYSNNNNNNNINMTTNNNDNNNDEYQDDDSKHKDGGNYN